MTNKASVLSLPPTTDRFESPALESYRVFNGVPHNPHKDRRTTEGVFRVAEEGLPIPADKKAVPKATFAALIRAALRLPAKLLQLPFTADQGKVAFAWAALLLRPIVVPEITAVNPQESMEVCFLPPGGLCANLNFVESNFGNAGDSIIPENECAVRYGPLVRPDRLRDPGTASHHDAQEGCRVAPRVKGRCAPETRRQVLGE
jgi:hypothetical protein